MGVPEGSQEGGLIMSAYKLESMAVWVVGLLLAVLVGIHVASAVSGALQKATAAFTVPVPAPAKGR